MSWTLLESQTLSGSQASITLGSGGTLNQGYKTLRVLVSSRCDSGNQNAALFLQPNASTSNLSSRTLYSTPWASPSAASQTTSTIEAQSVGGTATANTFGSSEFVIPNYSGSTYKAMSGDGVGENNATFAIMSLGASLWSNTAAITSLKLLPDSGNFVAGSTVTLYGLK